MPRAGWCRECGEWVWVDAEGACQHGHGPESVERIHDQDDPSATVEQSPAGVGEAPAFGVGEMPQALRRFSWGAFLLTPVWGAVYGVWPVLSAWLLTILVPLVVTSLVPADASYSAVALATVVSQVITSALRLWIGMSAVGWLWRREASRLSLVPDARPRRTVDAFVASQRRWVVACGVYVSLSIAGLLMMALSRDAVVLEALQQLGLTPTLVWISLGWTVAELALAAWLDTQMRKPSRSEPAGEH